MKNYKEENRNRLIQMLSMIQADKNPQGWLHVTKMAIGGLISVGFSKSGPYLLVVSHQGRGVIDCNTGEKVSRDDEAYAGLDQYELECLGIGVIEDEKIKLCGHGGGGIPHSNSAGEGLQLVAPNWPEYDLILSRNFKHPLILGHQSECATIYTGHVTAYGFSWCGNYIVAACGSDLDLWKRSEKL